MSAGRSSTPTGPVCSHCGWGLEVAADICGHCNLPTRTGRSQALLEVKRTCVEHDRTPLVTPQDVEAADQRMYERLVAAGWTWEPTDDASGPTTP